MIQCTRCKKKLTKENIRILHNSLGAPRPYCKECAFDKNWKIRLNVQGAAPVKLKTSLLLHKIYLIFLIVVLGILNIILYPQFAILLTVDLILILFIITILSRYSNLVNLKRNLK